jgi:hypothetical protein
VGCFVGQRAVGGRVAVLVAGAVRADGAGGQGEDLRVEVNNGGGGGELRGGAGGGALGADGDEDVVAVGQDARVVG